MHKEVSAVFPWPQFLAYVLVTAGTPGPNTLMSMGNGSRLGFRRALPFNFGIWAGFSVVMLPDTGERYLSLLSDGDA